MGSTISRMGQFMSTETPHRRFIESRLESAQFGIRPISVNELQDLNVDVDIHELDILSNSTLANATSHHANVANAIHKLKYVQQSRYDYVSGELHKVAADKKFPIAGSFISKINTQCDSFYRIGTHIERLDKLKHAVANLEKAVEQPNIRTIKREIADFLKAGRHVEDIYGSLMELKNLAVDAAREEQVVEREIINDSFQLARNRNARVYSRPGRAKLPNVSIPETNEAGNRPLELRKLSLRLNPNKKYMVSADFLSEYWQNCFNLSGLKIHAEAVERLFSPIQLIRSWSANHQYNEHIHDIREQLPLFYALEGITDNLKYLQACSIKFGVWHRRIKEDLADIYTAANSSPRGGSESPTRDDMQHIELTIDQPATPLRPNIEETPDKLRAIPDPPMLADHPQTFAIMAEAHKAGLRKALEGLCPTGETFKAVVTTFALQTLAKTINLDGGDRISGALGAIAIVGVKDFFAGSIAAHRHILGYDFHRGASTTHHEHRLAQNLIFNPEDFATIEEWARSRRPIDLDIAQEVAAEVSEDAQGKSEVEQIAAIKQSASYKKIKVPPDDRDIKAILVLIAAGRKSLPDSLKKYVELCRAEPEPLSLNIVHHANKSLRSGQSSSDGFAYMSFLLTNPSAYFALCYKFARACMKPKSD